jgi:hypothetical protein
MDALIEPGTDEVDVGARQRLAHFVPWATRWVAPTTTPKWMIDLVCFFGYDGEGFIIEMMK